MKFKNFIFINHHFNNKIKTNQIKILSQNFLKKIPEINFTQKKIDSSEIKINLCNNRLVN